MLNVIMPNVIMMDGFMLSFIKPGMDEIAIGEKMNGTGQAEQDWFLTPLGLKIPLITVHEL